MITMQQALVIDDSEIDRQVITHILRTLGMRCIEEEDGERAYSTLIAHPEVRVVFVDWNMPVLNGIELTRRIRSESRFADLKLIMVTGATEMEEVKEALDAGVDEYIMKPLDREMFREKLAIVGIRAGSTSDEGM